MPTRRIAAAYNTLAGLHRVKQLVSLPGYSRQLRAQSRKRRPPSHRAPSQCARLVGQAVAIKLVLMFRHHDLSGAAEVAEPEPALEKQRGHQRLHVAPPSFLLHLIEIAKRLVRKAVDGTERAEPVRKRDL